MHIIKNNNTSFKILLRLTHSWIKPSGFDTGIKVYNCIVKDKVPLIVNNKHLITWYTCGPTVYDSSHLGHASCYVKLDIIQRILKEYFRFNLVTVMNITDVDDKIIKRSNEMKIPVKELANKYEKEFWDDLEALNVCKPDLILHVTDHIELIKQFIEMLVENKKAYVSGDGSVYFDVSTMQNYGKLQNIGKDNVSVNSEEHFKKSPQDFALWKASKPGEISWDSKWGLGRPGWHIECSALAGNIFGASIDIHAGGIDLRFPHHENEEAQSCAYYSKSQWVNYWLHTGHLHAGDNTKMSKSLKNTIRISELLKEYKSDVFRMACFMSHYRNNMDFSKALMETASNNLGTINNFFASCEACVKNRLRLDLSVEEGLAFLEKTSVEIGSAFCDDFNTPAVLKSLNNLIAFTNKRFQNITSTNNNQNVVPVLLLKNYVANIFELLGITRESHSFVNNASDEFIAAMNILNDFRQDIRIFGIESKNKTILKYCDDVRENAKKYGFVIKDYGKESSWSKQ